MPFFRGLDDAFLLENLSLEQEHYEVFFSVCDLDAIKFLKTPKRNKVEKKLLAMNEIFAVNLHSCYIMIEFGFDRCNNPILRITYFKEFIAALRGAE